MKSCLLDERVGNARQHSLPRHWFVLGVVLLLGQQGGCQSSRTIVDQQGRRPSQVVQLYVDLIKKGEPRQAYALRTDEIQMNLDFSAFQSFVKEKGSNDPISWEVVSTIKPVGEVLVDSNQAKVEVEYQREGRRHRMTIICNRQGGVWKLGEFG